MWQPGCGRELWGRMDTCIGMAESFVVHQKPSQHCQLVIFHKKKVVQITIKDSSKRERIKRLHSCFHVISRYNPIKIMKKSSVLGRVIIAFGRVQIG